jgi:hypothetical protein
MELYILQKFISIRERLLADALGTIIRAKCNRECQRKLSLIVSDILAVRLEYCALHVIKCMYEVCTFHTNVAETGVITYRSYSGSYSGERQLHVIFFLFWFVRLLALRPLLAYCASLG